MDESALNRKMLNITAYASQYCEAVENAREMEKDEFVERMTELLPQIYGEFAGLSPEDVGVLDYGYYQIQRHADSGVDSREPGRHLPGAV